MIEDQQKEGGDDHPTNMPFNQAPVMVPSPSTSASSSGEENGGRTLKNCRLFFGLHYGDLVNMQHKAVLPL